MESLNLNTLANSLPTTQQNAEKELLNDFKAAALSITTLYRSSRKTSKRAYNAGYGAACQDMLNFIQQGVSASDIGQSPSGSSTAVEGGGMTIGRVMDWTEARLDAIKAREEEEEEDEDKERAQSRGGSSVAVPPPVVSKSEGKKSVPIASTHRPKHTTISLPTPNSPISRSSAQPPSEPSSPSPPPLGTASTSTTRTTKVRPTPPTTATIQATNISESFPPTTSSVMFPGAGAKRRHAMMMMLDSASPAISIGGPSSVVSSPGGTGGMNAGTTGSNLSRRRTRSARNLNQLQSQNQNIIQMGSEAMDIEEDGRERKRVARR